MDEANGEGIAVQRNVLMVRQQHRPPVLNVRDLLATGFRYQRVLVSCFLGIVLLAALVAFLIPRQYESEAKILVKHQRVDPVLTPGADQVQTRESVISGEELNSEVELIRSDDLFRKVVIECGLVRPANGQVELERNIGEATAPLRSRLKVEVLPKTNMLSIRYSSRSAELSARVVDTVVSSYLEKHVAVHSSSDLGFFDQEVAKYSDELEKAEAALSEFSQGKNGVVTPQAQRDAMLQKQNEFEAMLQETRSQISETNARIRTLEKEAALAPDRVTTQVRSSDNPQLMQDLKATLLKLELKRTELLAKYKPTYPPLQELEQEIATTEAALSSAKSSPLRDQTTDVNPIRQWTDSELAKAKAQLQSLDSRADNLSRIVETYKRQAVAMDGQQLRYGDLVRNAKSAEENYALYTRKREEARITHVLDQHRILNVTVIQPATHSYIPNRSRASYFLVGLALATVLTAGLWFTLEHADNTFRTPQQLEQFVQIPVLATVPVVPWTPQIIPGKPMSSPQ
jgi:uncharacterized protein involved in exopolysaccharide biosynthesis